MHVPLFSLSLVACPRSVAAHSPVGLSLSEKFRYSVLAEIMLASKMTPQSSQTMWPCLVSVTTLSEPQETHSGVSNSLRRFLKALISTSG